MISVAAVEAPQSQLLGDVCTASVIGELPTKKEGLVFRSKLPDIDIPNHLPLHAYCFEKVEEFSDRPCLIDGAGGRVYSFAETHLMCRKVAAGLGKVGVEKGDVIMVMLPNSPEFVFCFMGASMAGAVTTTANPFYTPAEIFKQLAGSGAKLVVTQSQYAGKLKDAGEQLDFKVVTADNPLPGCLHFSDLLNSGEIDFPVVSTFDPEAAVAMPFSSGTTGLPKGVVLTHKSLISTTAQQVSNQLYYNYVLSFSNQLYYNYF